MENKEVIKSNICSEDIQISLPNTSVLVRSEIVPSEVNISDEKSDCPPRRNGLFGITRNLKVHRNNASGR